LAGAIITLGIWGLLIYAGRRIAIPKNRGRWWGVLGVLGLIIVALLSPREPRGTATAVVEHTPAAVPASVPVELPPAGWYADPYDAANLRYWDGSYWTGNVAPAGTAVAAPG
jgi:hypothetical protein